LARQGKALERAEGSMSKLVAGETAVRVTEQAIQILGSNGYTREHPVERWHRDAKMRTLMALVRCRLVCRYDVGENLASQAKRFPALSQLPESHCGAGSRAAGILCWA
jgi:hypothetical protein